MDIEKDVWSLPPPPHQEPYAAALNINPTDVIGQRLLPVPSDDPKGKSPHFTGLSVAESGVDPLTWPLTFKIFVFIQVSLLSALGGINVAMINPAYVPIAKELNIDTIRAGYQTTVCIVLAGVASLCNSYDESTRGSPLSILSNHVWTSSWQN